MPAIRRTFLALSISGCQPISQLRAESCEDIHEAPKTRACLTPMKVSDGYEPLLKYLSAMLARVRVAGSSVNGQSTTRESDEQVDAVDHAESAYDAQLDSWGYLGHGALVVLIPPIRKGLIYGSRCVQHMQLSGDLHSRDTPVTCSEPRGCNLKRPSVEHTSATLDEDGYYPL